MLGENMNFKMRIFLLLFFFIHCSVQAQDFQEHLISFLKAYDRVHFNNSIIVLCNDCSPKTWETCPFPKFILLDSIKSSEFNNVKVICEKSYHILKVKFVNIGEYFIASRNIVKGTKITDKDIFVKYGHLNKIPVDAYTNQNDVLGLVSTKDIKKNEFMTKSLFCPIWLIKLNQKVSVIIKSSGFTIFAEGNSINNAYEGQEVKVKLNNGTIILGIAKDRNSVIVYK